MKSIFSVIESPTHPYFTALYKELGLDELCFQSMRKVIKAIKNNPPNFVATEFFYGYGNNYAGINISNLDVMLYSLQRYSPKTKVIVFVEKEERQYVDKLSEILPLYAILTKPVTTKTISTVLKGIES